MINTASAKNKQTIFDTGSFEQVPVEDHFFDFICITGLTGVQTGLIALFREVDRLLRPGGKLCTVISSGSGLKTGRVCKCFFEASHEQRVSEEAVIYYGMEAGFAFLKKSEPFINGFWPEPGCLELGKKLGYSLFYEISGNNLRKGTANSTVYWFLKTNEQP